MIIKDNDYNLSLLLLSDFGAATLAGAIAAPFVTIVDKVIIQNISSSVNLETGIKNEIKDLILRPMQFFRRPEFFMVWGVYSITYLTANCSDTISENYNFDEKDSQLAKLGGTTFVNMGSCILKDRAFTMKYGLRNPSGLPLITYKLFFLRDIISIGSSFNLPHLVAEDFSEKYNFKKENIEVIAQFFLPGLFQFVSTPIHLLAIDFHNRSNINIKDRLKLISKSYNSAVTAKIMRFTWSFGLGGISNNYFKRFFNKNLESFFKNK